MADPSVTPVAPITPDEAPFFDSTKLAPPAVSYDGHKKHIGAAHGRVAPLIGLYRPYLLDVGADKITDNHLRVYADSADDAIGVLVGDPLPQVIAELAAAEESLPESPLSEEVIDDDLYGAFGDELVVSTPLSEEEQATYAAYLAGVDAIKDLRVQMAGLIAGHADGVRCVAQQEINAAAKKDGRWDALTDEERSELESAADAGPDGTFPVGVLEEVPFVHLERDESEPQLVERGVWSAQVPIVCNRGNYFPWGETLAPESMVTGESESGEQFLVPGDPNIVWLEIDSPSEYLDSLEAAGLVDVATFPVLRPNDFMRPFMEEHRVKTLRRLRDFAEGMDDPIGGDGEPENTTGTQHT